MAVNTEHQRVFAAKALIIYTQASQCFQLYIAGENYSNETAAWMEENLHFVEKASNPPNVH